MQRYKRYVIETYGGGEFDQIPIDAGGSRKFLCNFSGATKSPYRDLAEMELEKAWDLLHAHSSPTIFDKIQAVGFIGAARDLFAIDNPFKRL